MRLTQTETEHLSRWLAHNWTDIDAGVMRWRLIERYLDTIDEGDRNNTLDRGWSRILADAQDWAIEEVTKNA